MDARHRLRTRVASYGLVLDRESRLLLCRLVEPGRASGRWTLPGGGVDFGEDLPDAARREILEETGLHVKLDGIADAHGESFDSDGSRFYAVRVIYWASATGGELSFESNGSTDRCAYFSFGEIKELERVPLVDRAVDILLRHRGCGLDP